MKVVLLLAGGASWETQALAALSGRRDLVVLKRCVDVADLLATAASGQADTAVVALEAPGFDLAAVDHLRSHGVRAVAVVATPGEESAVRAARIGVRTTVAEADLEALPAAVTAEHAPTPPPEPPDPQAPPPAGGRVLAVFGPAGAPGRTTVATALAGALSRTQRTTLVDADPYGGSVAQHLGVLDEVSGLLSAARLTADGALEARFGSVRRAIGDRLAVITGLPRADRWVEVRPGVVEHLLEVARACGHVVVDTGFSLEDDPAGDLVARPGRNHLTLAALEVADEVLVVGTADPVGLARLARGLVELRERHTEASVRVVVNRMRPSLGWSERDITGMVEGFARPTDVHFLPDDRAAADRALTAGASIAEAGDSEIARALGMLSDAVVPPPVPHRRRERRRLLRR